jgi:hypothetical protein
LSHRRERKQLKKEKEGKKEYVYIFTQYYCNDGKRGWDEYDPVRKVEKKHFDELKKRIFND